MDEIIATCVQQQIRISRLTMNSGTTFSASCALPRSRVASRRLSRIERHIARTAARPGLQTDSVARCRAASREEASLFDRMVGRAADSAADALGGFGKSLTDAVIEHESTIRDAYFSTFSEIARSLRYVYRRG